jgi:hypothetical protein
MQNISMAYAWKCKFNSDKYTNVSKFMAAFIPQYWTCTDPGSTLHVPAKDEYRLINSDTWADHSGHAV